MKPKSTFAVWASYRAGPWTYDLLKSPAFFLCTVRSCRYVLMCSDSMAGVYSSIEQFELTACKMALVALAPESEFCPHFPDLLLFSTAQIQHFCNLQHTLHVFLKEQLILQVVAWNPRVRALTRDLRLLAQVHTAKRSVPQLDKRLSLCYQAGLVCASCII